MLGFTLVYNTYIHNTNARDSIIPRIKTQTSINEVCSFTLSSVNAYALLSVLTFQCKLLHLIEM